MSQCAEQGGEVVLVPFGQAVSGEAARVEHGEVLADEAGNVQVLQDVRRLQLHCYSGRLLDVNAHVSGDELDGVVEAHFPDGGNAHPPVENTAAPLLVERPSDVLRPAQL